MLIFVVLYITAGFLQHIGVYHIPIWGWFIPLWLPLLVGVGEGLVLVSKKFPLLSLPLLVAWGYALLKIFSGLGVL